MARNKKTPARKAISKARLAVKANPLRKQATGGPGIFSNFEAAKFSNKRSWIWSSWPNDRKKAMTVFDRLETTRKMRWMELNAGLIRQVLNDYVIYGVGDGITAQCRTGNPVLDDKYEEYFSKWAAVPCEVTNRYNLYELQQIIIRLMMRDGECFVIKTRVDGKPKLQVLESHRVGNGDVPPEGMVDGIMFGKYGRPEWYNVIRTDGTSRKVPANAVLHVYAPEVVSGARAYSPLQHAINQIIDMLEVISLEAFAVKTNSDITRTITRETGQFDNSQGDFEAFGMRPQNYGPNGMTDPDQASTFIGGKIIALAPGEKLESFQSNRPNSTFVGYLEHTIRDALCGVLPYSFVYDSSKSGGASMRLDVAKADRQFKQAQTVLINRLLTPVWGFIIGDGIDSGELPANDNWTRVMWTTPRRVTVDAGRDSNANRADIAMGIKTLSENAQEEGEHFTTQLARRIHEAKMIVEKCSAAGVPLWMVYKPEGAIIQDLGVEPQKVPEPPDENEDAEDDLKDDYEVEDENQNPGDTLG